jgi:hypothetical protein
MRNVRAINKATYHLHAGLTPTRTSGGWLVTSGTRDNIIHRVSDTHGCTCEAASKGFACWHSSLVEIIQVSHERLLTIAQPGKVASHVRSISVVA